MNAEDEDVTRGGPGRPRHQTIFISWRKVAARLLAFLIVVGAVAMILRYFLHASR